MWFVVFIDVVSFLYHIFQQFTIDPNFNTIELADPQLAMSALDIGQRISFSWNDEVGLNKYYQCDDGCPLTCQNGGYVRRLDDGSCRCFCPPGLGEFIIL